MNKKLITICKYDLKFDYYACDDGRIWSEKTKKFLSKQLDKDGYEKVQLISVDGKRHRYSVHRLILENFDPIDNMENFHVDHIDGNKRNNVLSNLEWVTCSENNKRAYKLGLKNQTGEKNNASKLTEENVKKIIDLLLTTNLTYKEIAKKFNVNEETVGAIKRKKNWKHLTKDIQF